MKAVIVISLMLTPTLMGCAHNYTVRPTEPEDYTSLNQRALQKQAIVTLMDGRTVPADKLRFAPDSTSWIDPNTRKVMTVRTTGVSNIRFVRRGKGALQGFGIGLLGGAVGGAIIGIAISDESADAPFTPGAAPFTVGIFFGGVGGLIGIPIGAAIGSKDVYHIQSGDANATTQK